MSRKYTNYKVNDFLVDDKFVDWVLYHKNDLFWTGLIKNNPEISREIEKAKTFIYSLNRTNRISHNYNIEIRKKEIWNKINSEVKLSTIKIKKIIYYAAAVIILFVGIFTLIKKQYLLYDNNIEFTENIVNEHESKEVKLFLADGSSVNISGEERNLKELDGTQITNKSNRTLIYNKSKKKIKLKEIYNQIIIPRGKRHNLVLADGTKVWLNSETTLKFPTQFVNDKRIVFLEGEAYFEVSHNDKKPFIVKTSKIDVNVKGTSFNVKAYKGEDISETTLEEGLVEIKHEDLKEKLLLKPGKQAIYSSKSKKTSIENVNTKLYTSWRNGKYVFKAERFDSLIITLNRWYNVNIVCDEIIAKNYKFTGVVSEDRSIEHIMELIHLSSKINYKIEDDKIYITK